MDNTVTVSFTVLFEEPFWIGIYEREYRGKYEACKITFGAEPKIYQIYEYLQKNHRKMRFSPAMKVEGTAEKHFNPKRMQRTIQKQLDTVSVGTKAQQALSLAREQNKTERKTRSKAEREAEKERLRDIKEQKHKEKHRGH